MDFIRTFLHWMVRSADKPEQLLFKNQKEALEFVRRTYNQNGAPTKELKSLYRDYKNIKVNGVRSAQPVARRRDGASSVRQSVQS